MHEIKFRAWNKKQNLMSYERPNQWIVSALNLISDTWIIMRYIGIKDKRGRDIYEGDIINYSISDTQHSTGVVKWDNARLCFFFDGKYKGTPDEYYLKQCEVVGNIYEQKTS